MKRETDKVSMLLVVGAALMQVAGLLALHHIGALQLRTLLQWWLTFL